MKLKHCMLDIETLGTGRDAFIASIGALPFDPMTGQVMDVKDTRAFHKLVSLRPGMASGTLDADTVGWWMRQSDAARAALFAQPDDSYKSLTLVLWEFHSWAEMHGLQYLWSNGPMFDERIVREACERQGIKFPFSFRASRCFRTISGMVEAKGLDMKALHKQFKAEVSSTPGGQEIVKHRAVDDCWAQAYSVCRFYQLLGLAPVQPIVGAGTCHGRS